MESRELLKKLDLNPYSARAELCRRQLFRFVKEFWGEIIFDEPVWNWHVPYLCGVLEEATETVIKNEKKLYDLVINICPGTTKSTLVSIMLPCWLWTIRPDLVILLNTISKNNATKFAMKRRDILTSDKFKAMFPDIELRSDAQAMYAIKNTHGGEMTQYTTKGKITGDHGHIRIDDDPMSYVDAISEQEAERCIEGYKAYSTRNKDASKTVYIQVMQRLSTRDTTQHVLNTLTKIRHIVLPAMLNDKVNPPELAEKYTDGFLDPVRLNLEALSDMKKGLAGDSDDPMSEAEFNAQYLQDLDLVEGLMYENKLVFKDLSKTNFDEADEDFCAIDPADDGTDPLGVIFGTLMNDKIYIRRVIYNSRDSDANIPSIVKLYHKFMPISTIVETNGLGAIFGKRLKEKGVRGIKGLNNGENKIGRIDSYKWLVWENFVFDQNMDNHNEDYIKFVKHLKTLPKDGNKKLVGAADVVTHMAKGLYKMGRLK